MRWFALPTPRLCRRDGAHRVDARDSAMAPRGNSTTDAAKANGSTPTTELRFQVNDLPLPKRS